MGSGEELKRTVRRLKKLEAKIRFGGMEAAGEGPFVWDRFFDLNDKPKGKARYPLGVLLAMDRDTFRRTVDEFFYHVYDRFYRESGIVDIPVHDAGLLEQMGLPPDADSAAIKKRFHELAMRCHPDAGGDANEFIALMEQYRALIGKGKE